jgi:hypothetical protein
VLGIISKFKGYLVKIIKRKMKKINKNPMHIMLELLELEGLWLTISSNNIALATYYPINP